MCFRLNHSNGLLIQLTIHRYHFHFKQAIRRKMIKLLISTKEVGVSMGLDMLALLAIMPHEQIDPHGIDHVTEKNQEPSA
jgi:hypothetical protein